MHDAVRDREFRESREIFADVFADEQRGDVPAGNVDREIVQDGAVSGVTGDEIVQGLDAVDRDQVGRVALDSILDLRERLLDALGLGDGADVRSAMWLSRSRSSKKASCCMKRMTLRLGSDSVVTYRDRRPSRASENMICSVSTVFPVPGSPATMITDPVGRPPPSTRSSAALPVPSRLSGE